jgi:hypothetical protein
MALYPTIKPVSVNRITVIVICPHCGDEHHHRMQHEGRDPIQPGERVLFQSTCTKTDNDYYLVWGCRPNQRGYYIQFPSPTRKGTR